jgi:hypothetical protein
MTAVYVEATTKRAIASAIDWPGWFRLGRNEQDALTSLVAVAPRYGSIAKDAGLAFDVPTDPTALEVLERLEGNSGTDYGVPAMILSSDAAPLIDEELDRAIRILNACWDALDKAAASAEGKELRKGPRGGGRELDAILRHVVESQAGYADRIGLKFKWGDLAELPDIREAMAESRERIPAGLREVADVGLPPPGPRGGARWPARYFVRRVAYHVVDHAWEIVDRVES